MNQNFCSQLESQLTELDQQIEGSLLFSSDPGFKQVKKVWNIAAEPTTCLIVRPKHAQDIVEVLDFAKRHRLPIAIRSGWHNSFVEYNTENQAIFIDLSDVNHIDVDAQSRIAHIGPGNIWGDVADALQPHKLAIPSGDTASVGVGGLAQGSGIGYLSRKYGLTIDALRSVEMVTSDGLIRRASKEENPDLFWGVRGGAGNFGIITDFEFDLFDGGEVLGGALYYEGMKTQEFMKIVELADKAPDELIVFVDMMTAPPFPFLPSKYHHQPMISATFCYTGNIDKGEAVIAPFREIGNIILDQVKPQPYKDLLLNLPEGVGFYGRNMYMETLDEQKAKTFVREINQDPTSNLSIQTRVLGGAISRVPKNYTAFSHRNKPYLVIITNFFTSMEEVDKNHAYNENVWKRLKKYAAGADVNFMGIGENGRLKDVYSEENLNRLSELKKRYDPENIFHNNLNLLPDTES
ncbi:FAD-binding oxidoreductase [Halobacillus ihumii]|uniref:FAD-binding oxidoreductase n=1 Tax=Halobacillus ihumii TaxID=2686092 RepID=UPI0013D10525|nr:FAD-binding oxidoreductase [Halobacillus ihumii]